MRHPAFRVHWLKDDWDEFWLPTEEEIMGVVPGRIDDNFYPEYEP